jgi:hypothetical protein
MGKIRKKQYLIDLIHKYDLDFVGIQETNSEIFTRYFFRNLGWKKTVLLELDSFKRSCWCYLARDK